MSKKAIHTNLLGRMVEYLRPLCVRPDIEAGEKKFYGTMAEIVNVYPLADYSGLQYDLLMHDGTIKQSVSPAAFKVSARKVTR